MSCKSAMGLQLERAAMFGVGSDGQPIRRRPRPAKPREDDPALWEVPCKPTRSTPNGTHGLEDRQEQSRAWESLSEEERAVLELQESLGALSVERTIVIAAGDLKRFFARGYRFVRSFEVSGPDGQLIACAEVSGRERNGGSYEDIAARLGMSPHQVHRRITSGRRKLRSKG